VLKPLEVMTDSYVQVEEDRLTHINFLKKGTAVYVIPRYNNKKYIEISEGDHFGVCDLVFRFMQHEKNARKKNDSDDSNSDDSSDRFGF
jgi:hypothetical protein